jgi:hypothetical protein
LKTTEPEHHKEPKHDDTSNLEVMLIPVLEQKNKITCEALDLLVTGGRQLLRSLLIVWHDLAQIRNGMRLVYALDFSEIYSYLWPEKSRTFSNQVIREILHTKNIEFTLTPGTTAEFLRNLKQLAATSEAARRRFEDFISKPIVAGFLRCFEAYDSKRGYSEVLAPLTSIQSGIMDFAHLSSVLSRLSFLNEMDNLLPFNSFISESELEIEPDPKIFAQSEMSLRLRRRAERDINNFIDAHNYALVWALSNAHVNKKNTIYLLATSSPIPYLVFRNLKWEHFPTTKSYRGLPGLSDLSLVRHPVQILYLSQIRNLEDPGKKELFSAIIELNNLLNTWENIPIFKDYRKGKAHPTAFINLPETKRYLATFLKFRSRYDRLFSRARTSIEADLIAEENVRQSRGVGPWALGSYISTEVRTASQTTLTRLVFDLYDSLSRLTLGTIKKFGSGLRGIPESLIAEVDTQCIISSRKQLTLSSTRNTEFSCEEVVVILKNSSEPYFSGDIYRDYFALWWSTRLSFPEFLNEVRVYLTNVRATLGDIIPLLNSGKEFNGIYLYLDDESAPITAPLDMFPDLNPDELLGMAKMKRILMIRIATEIGDLCYDFTSTRGLPQRTGIISHLVSIESLSSLIYNSNQKKVALIEVRRIVREFLSRFEKGENQTHDKT